MDELEKYCIKHLISCQNQGSHLILDISFENEDGFGWVEGEGMLPDLLPLYHEIKAANYHFLRLLSNVHQAGNTSLTAVKASLSLSPAQQAFFKYAEIDHNCIA